MNKSTAGIFVVLSAAAALFFVLALMPGPVRLPAVDILNALGGLGPETAVLIVREIRLPRALLAALTGATLGLAGAAMQGLLRNPLAEPGIIGVTGGAVLGAVAVFYGGAAGMTTWLLPAGGMAGAFLAVTLIVIIAGTSISSQTLILAGVAVNTLAFAGTALILNLTQNPYAAVEIVFWQLGSVADRSLQHVLLSLPFILAGWIVLLLCMRELDALSLGEETGTSLGISLKRLQLKVIAGTALCVGAAVSVCGSIGFVGLVVPHLLRPAVGHRPGLLLPASALGGTLMLLLSDMLVRLIPGPVELKLGVVTALAGAPFFILLLFQMKRRMN